MPYIIKTMTDLAGYLSTAFQAFNQHSFHGLLPEVIISFEPGKRKHAYGWFYTVKAWAVDGGAKYGIVIASDHLDRPIEQICGTLLHEMCHLYAQENDIQDTSRSGSYHNARFREIAEQAGLACTFHQKDGWASTEPDPVMLQWIREHLPQAECKLVFSLPKPQRSGDPKKKNGFFVYVCPECGATVRTTKELRLSCGGTEDHVHAPQMLGLSVDG